MNEKLLEEQIKLSHNLDTIEACEAYDQMASENYSTALMEIQRLKKEAKVFCTLDGDYPTVSQMCVFEAKGKMFIGSFVDRGELGTYWSDTEGYEQFFNIRTPVYWQPFVSMQSRHEQQKFPTSERGKHDRV